MTSKFYRRVHILLILLPGGGGGGGGGKLIFTGVQICMTVHKFGMDFVCYLLFHLLQSAKPAYTHAIHNDSAPYRSTVEIIHWEMIAHLKAQLISRCCCHPGHLSHLQARK